MGKFGTVESIVSELPRVWFYWVIEKINKYTYLKAINTFRFQLKFLLYACIVLIYFHQNNLPKQIEHRSKQNTKRYFLRQTSEKL